MTSAELNACGATSTFYNWKQPDYNQSKWTTELALWRWCKCHPNPRPRWSCNLLRRRLLPRITVAVVVLAAPVAVSVANAVAAAPSCERRRCPQAKDLRTPNSLR